MVPYHVIRLQTLKWQNNRHGEQTRWLPGAWEVEREESDSGCERGSRGGTVPWLLCGPTNLPVRWVCTGLGTHVQEAHTHAHTRTRVDWRDVKGQRVVSTSRFWLRYCVTVLREVTIRAPALLFLTVAYENYQCLKIESC